MKKGTWPKACGKEASNFERDGIQRNQFDQRIRRRMTMRKNALLVLAALVVLSLLGGAVFADDTPKAGTTRSF